jgi:hypothetical protein
MPSGKISSRPVQLIEPEEEHFQPQMRISTRLGTIFLLFLVGYTIFGCAYNYSEAVKLEDQDDKAYE